MWIIPIVILLQVVLLVSLKTNSKATLLAVIIATTILALVQLIRPGADPNMDPVIFSTQYLPEQMGSPLLVGRHFFIPYFNYLSSFSLSAWIGTAFNRLSLLTYILALSLGFISICLAQNTQPNKNGRAEKSLALLLIFIVSVPSSILLFNNFISQGISASLCLLAFAVALSDMSLPIKSPLLILSISLAALNHSSSAILSVLFLAVLLQISLFNKLRLLTSQKEIALLLLSAAATILCYSLAFDAIFTHILESDKFSAYASSFQDTNIFRLIPRVLYPYLVGFVLLRPSRTGPIIYQSPLLICSLLGSFISFFLFISGLKGVAWRLEYYFSLLSSFSLCWMYAKGFLEIRRGEMFYLSSTIVLILAIVPYLYPNILRLYQ